MSMSIRDHAENAHVAARERGVAFLCYGFLFFATFTLGLLAVLAALLAYGHKNSPDPVARSHFRKQIKSFWFDIVLIILGGVAGYLALAGGISTALGWSGVTLPGGVTTENAGWTTLARGVAWAVLWIWGFLNLIIGSVAGAARLAAGKPIGHLPHP
jgi:uncharacterized membrane protein